MRPAGGGAQALLPVAVGSPRPTPVTPGSLHPRPRRPSAHGRQADRLRRLALRKSRDSAVPTGVPGPLSGCAIRRHFLSVATTGQLSWRLSSCIAGLPDTLTWVGTSMEAAVVPLEHSGEDGNAERGVHGPVHCPPWSPARAPWGSGVTTRTHVSGTGDVGQGGNRTCSVGLGQVIW